MLLSVFLENSCVFLYNYRNRVRAYTSGSWSEGELLPHIISGNRYFPFTQEQKLFIALSLIPVESKASYVYFSAILRFAKQIEFSQRFSGKINYLS